MHHELPERLHVDWYRRRRRPSGPPPRVSRAPGSGRLIVVRDVAGDCAPIKPAHAQHVIAVEHGFSDAGRVQALARDALAGSRGRVGSARCSDRRPTKRARQSWSSAPVTKIDPAGCASTCRAWLRFAWRGI